MVARYIYGEKTHVPTMMVKNGITYKILSDHLGSVRQVIHRATGEVAQALDYDAWGSVLVNTSPDFQSFGYAGGLYDRDTDLLRYGARDYDSIVGRWTGKDRIRSAGGDTNLFAYVGNSPISYIDPTGLEADAIWINPSDPTYAPGLSIPRVPGRYSILAHATSFGPLNESENYLSVKEAATRILGDPNYRKGTPVDFYACNLGKGDFPQKLADAIGAPIHAAPGYLSVFPGFNNGYGGGMLVSPYRITSRPYPWPAPLPFLPMSMLEFSPGGSK